MILKDIKITVIQHYDDKYKSVFETVEVNNEEYCLKHNLKYLKAYGDQVPSIITGKNRVYWNKIFFLKTLLPQSSDDEWFFLMDGDSAFIDHTIDLRVIPYLSCPDRDLLACNVYVQDMSWISWNINAGNLFIRPSMYMRIWIDSLIDIVYKTNGEHVDQPIIQQMLRENYHYLAQKTSFFPSTVFNGTEGNFIFHACGHSTCDVKDAIPEKIKILKEKVKNRIL